MANVDTAKFIAFVNEKWGGRSCPMCQKGPWSVQDKVYQLSEFHDGSLVVGGPLIPVIPLTCSNCGHTVLVNALLSGAIPQPVAPAEKKE